MHHRAIIRPNKPDIITEYPLKNWEIPKYTERLKESFQLCRNTLEICKVTFRVQ
jgi:hypothetical protein